MLLLLLLLLLLFVVVCLWAGGGGGDGGEHCFPFKGERGRTMRGAWWGVFVGGGAGGRGCGTFLGRLVGRVWDDGWLLGRFWGPVFGNNMWPRICLSGAFANNFRLAARDTPLHY